jgi:predicted dehydrogenase
MRHDTSPTGRIAIIGAGFVADFYMRSLETFPGIEIFAVFDRDKARLDAFCAHWGVPAAASLEQIIRSDVDLVVNLTNPASHFDVSRACLEGGKHVYSEKPLALTMEEAHALCALARTKGLILASAPCSLLGRSAQAVWAALRRGDIGKPYLVYAELDDDFITQAPYRRWHSEAGAPWPYRDEFKTGCTLEHAGYYLTWLMAMFGSVTSVNSFAAELISNKLEDGSGCAPDYSSASLVFESGVVARLTCSIIAPHDHAMRIFGERGVLEIDECWSNAATVRVRRRHVIRRRLLNSPFAKKLSFPGKTHPMVGRRGATSMNFALGPAEILSALREKRQSRLDADFALHLNEVTLAIQATGAIGRSQRMITRCPPIVPMPWAQL